MPGNESAKAMLITSLLLTNMASDSDPELEEFQEFLENNEEEIKDLIDWELETAQDVFEDLDDEKSQLFSPSDILGKVDDVVGWLKDWFENDDDNSDTPDDMTNLPDEDIEDLLER